MGAEPWSYFVPYQENVETALEDLKRQEFAAGRYNMRDRGNPPATIEEAVKQAGATGTQSVLDMQGVADTPLVANDDSSDSFDLANAARIGLVSPLSTEQLITLYGTDKPTRKMIERGEDLFWEWLDRGLGLFIVAYDNDRPSVLFFAGYSFD